MNNNNKKISLEDLGYYDFFEKKRIEMGLENYPVARVVAEYKGSYKVKNETGEYIARITGNQLFLAKERKDFPAVGDWVVISDLIAEQASIREILPRKTVLARKYNNKPGEQIIATNIDYAFITEAMDRDYNLNRIERYLVLVKEGGIEPIIVLNKIDLLSSDILQERIVAVKKRFPHTLIVQTSIFYMNEIREYLSSGKTYCFLGSSGVGKSTLINTLIGEDKIKTGEINMLRERGKHTTTTRSMYFLKNGGIVIDTPGMREVGLVAASTGLKRVFVDIDHLSKLCKYADCTHIHEPGCAVLEAVEKGILDADVYSHYITLHKESNYYAMTDLEKKRKDRKFGQFIKNYKDKK